MEVGAQLQAGQGQVVTVVEITDEGALIDFNHALAGARCSVLCSVLCSWRLCSCSCER